MPAGLSEAKREKERRRYEYAPLVIAVVSRIDTASSVPAIEQRLAAGNVAYNLLLGAQALGFGAQWLTGWAAYDQDVAALLGLGPNEGIVGFVHVGTPVDGRARTRTPGRGRGGVVVDAIEPPRRPPGGWQPVRLPRLAFDAR